MTKSNQSIVDSIQQENAAARQAFIIQSFTDNYAALIANDPAAWCGKFRKMAESPFAFYRGSAGLFYADVSRDTDPFLNEQTSRVWIQGDLHAQNFGTYMNGAGTLVFDVNDFDEATLAPFTWDLKRFCASLALIGYQKAMSDTEIREIVRMAAQSYTRQIARFEAGEDRDFALTLANTEGTVKAILQQARTLTRVGMLDNETEIVEGDRRLKDNRNFIQLSDADKLKVEAAMSEYFQSIPTKKKRAKINYQIKSIARRKGLGIGSAGLLILSILLEGETEALENDILISMKHAQPSAAARYVKDAKAAAYFKNEGERTAISQRALQAHADPFLGHATYDGKGMFVTEVSPYTADLEWDDLNDMDDILQVVESLGRCVAKIHCVSDDDSDQTLIAYSTEKAIHNILDGREADFVAYITDFGVQYAECVRNDHRLFVDAFRNKQITGI